MVRQTRLAALSPIVTGVLLIALIFFVFFALAWVDPFGWLASPDNKKAFYSNAVLGFAASVLASVFVIWAFSIRASRDLAEHVADAASQRAVTEVLKLLDMVPEQVFEASTEPDECFEAKFAKDFATSSYYYVFSASARHCSHRLNELSKQGKLDGKQVLIFVLDPSQPEHLEAHARKRLGMNPSVRALTPDSLEQEIANVRRELFLTIVRLYNLAKVHDIDLRFHTSYVFFRSEIFETGFFLTFQRGIKPFPGSAYYPRTSPVYEAYRTHFQHHASLYSQDRFSLQRVARAGKPLDQVLSDLGCHLKVDDLLVATPARLSSPT